MSTTFGRRALLLGGAAAGLAACSSAKDGDDRGPRVESGSFTSAAMGGRTGWTIARPEGHEDDSLPVVISLHGRRNTHRTAFSQLHLDDALAQAVRTSGVVPFAVASVDGGAASYWHARADGTDPVRMLVTEFLPLLESKGLDVGRLGLHGWSMGGYGALLLAGTKKLVVRGVAVSSPALFASAGDTPQGAFDDAADFARHDVYGHPRWLRGIPVRIDCGTEDPFYATSSAFAPRLRPRASGSFTPGGHDAAYWRRVAPTQLRFLGTQLG